MYVHEYVEYDCLGLAKLIQSGQVSAREVLNCARQRMDEINPSINAVVFTCEDIAEQQLQALTGKEPFYGVPLLVKDLGFALANCPDIKGSRFFKNKISPKTSTYMEKLLNAGFIPFAKTNSAELGLSYVTEPALFGPTRNPLDLDRTPGGSSGGSAAAVAARIAPIATASDGGGSIRIPAACCGLFGLKPGNGIMPPHTLQGESWSGMGTHHVLTRSIRDSKAVFDLTSDGLLEVQNAILPPKLKIAQLSGAFASVPVANECLKALTVAQTRLEDRGFQVDTLNVDLDLEGIGQCVIPLIAANTYAAIVQQEHELGHKAGVDELEPVTLEFYRLGQSISAADMLLAKGKLFQLLQPVFAVFKQYDIILSPTLAQLPLKIGALSTGLPFETYLTKNTEFTPFTSLFNQTGLPACSIPVMKTDPLPVSVQFAANFWNEGVLFALGDLLSG